MEDDDVERDNKFSDPVVEAKKVDSLFVANSDAKKIVITENNSGSHSEEEENNVTKEDSSSSIDRLKNALINHDTVNVNRCTDNEDICADLSSPSPKKINGEVNKSDSVLSSEESCDYEKNNVEDTRINENLDKEAISSAESSDKRKRSLSDRSNVSGSENEFSDETSPGSSPNEFRGFKRRKILRSEAEKGIASTKVSGSTKLLKSDATNEPEKHKSPELRRSARNASNAKKQLKEDKMREDIISIETKEESGDQLTEYAQYLGLQPTVKFKCGRCGEKHFQSMASLNAHQMICCKTASNALVKQSAPQSDSNLTTNFRITRKVYLCSACGTYYENWKLFLHMRDMHKRHICLFCLGMFSVAERLAEHLLYQHNVHEKICKSPEEFLNLFKGSCYLTCCSCEKMFTERDDFYDHQCRDPVAANAPNWNKDSVTLTPKEIKELAQKCSYCGVKCGHFRTCPKVAHKFTQNAPSSSYTNSTNTTNSNSSNLSLEKYYVPVPANVQKNWLPNNQEILKQVLSVSHTEKDYYDVGSAASFCHVDIANDSDSASSPEKARAGRSNFDHKKCPKFEGQKSSPEPQDVSESRTNEDKGEQQDNSSKSLTNVNNNNINMNLVSDKSDNPESKPDSSSNEAQDNEPVGRCSGGEGSIKDVDDDDRMSTEENDTPAEDLQKMEEDKTEENEGNAETKAAIVISDSDNTTVDNKLDIENVVRSCDGKLDNIEENPATNEPNSNEESNSHHDDNDSNSSSSSSSKNSIDNDDGKDVTDKEKTEDDNGSDKDVRPDERPVDEEALKSPLTNDENISSLNEETSDNRFENKNEIDKSDGNESEDSDKLSVVLSEDPEENINDDDDTDVPTDEQHNNDSLDNHSEDETTRQTDGGGGDRDGDEDDHSNKDDSLDNHSEDDTTRQTDGGGSGGGDGSGDDEDDDDEHVDDHVSEENNTDNVTEESQNATPPKENSFQCDGVVIQLASEEVMAMALTLEEKMESLSSQSVVKECVRTSCTTCSYCSHAVKIAVNGKQLAIHLLTEHRYMPVRNETVDDIIERLKRSLDELRDVWFNTDSYDSSNKACFVPYDHTYECFQCNYVANTHKDLFNHKRKVHQKTILYCSMCKENFYSYSELLCHMCPGLYDAAKDIQFRCCLCISDRIPSAFRLMVHLRKSHHTCDICLEIVDDQQKLSAHMVKHKLHHLCYRCGIAYRNKPDITKHLFWKHGTESVLCKKCLQKKWPHVYHFCIPPNSFICEECNLSFSKAVYLKVHKRFHSDNLPYSCNVCDQRFVSKKLLVKHGRIHEPITAEENLSNDNVPKSTDADKNCEQDTVELGEPTVPLEEESVATIQRTETPEKPDEVSTKLHKKKNKKDRDRKIKPVVDVYDLPPLNLSSESDDSDDEKETKAVPTKVTDKESDCSAGISVDEELETLKLPNDEMPTDTNPEESEMKTTENPVDDETVHPVPVIDGIWDNFHSYKAEQEKRENLDIANKHNILSQLDPTQPPALPKDSVLGDHDYCLPSNTSEIEGQTNETEEAADKTNANEHSSSIDHDYCTQKDNSVENGNVSAAPGLPNTLNQNENTETPTKRKQKSPKKKLTKQHNNSSSSSDSSSDSDSSSCSCGTNCSCTSSSSNSSSSSSSDSDSSSSDGRNNSSNTTTNNKREKKKERLKNKKKVEVVKTEPVPTVVEPIVNVPVELEEPVIKESDLDTDETATDEEFYDEYPQMRANQILAEKRNQLMVLAAVAPTVNNGTASPPVPNANSTNINLDPIGSPKLEIVTSPVAQVNQPQNNKKKVKSKKRRKSSLSTTSKNRNVIKQHSYDMPQPSTSFSTTQWQPTVHLKKVSDSSLYVQSPTHHAIAPVTSNDGAENTLSPAISHQQTPHVYPATSEGNSSKRFSKRRRVRNKFYGYSSDEDGEHHQANPPPAKWKKFSPVDGNVKHTLQYPQSFQQANSVQPEYNNSYQHTPVPPPPVAKTVPPTTIRTTYNENQTNDGVTVKRTVISAPPSSGSSSDSDADSDSDSNRLTINQQMNAPNVIPTGLNVTSGTSEKDDKLYCYCQCPYDEVSEMIACDGIDCAIEWFHFECVGIMVPPKGKWYCPDCRKRRGLS